MAKKRTTKKPLAVEVTRHRSEKRLNIPTAEYEPIVPDDERQPRPLRYPRNRDLDPQLAWRGKDEQDWSDLVIPAPPLYIQEKVQPKALVDDLLRETKARRDEENPPQPSLFGDFNGLPEGAERTEFYRHHGNWSNRMILGDSLRVMASLAEREGLRGKVQCIYFDPPYGIKFNSNFQWSTTSRDVKDGKREHISREPEQVKAFRDTWRDGIHSYLTYLRDRLTVARDLLTESGSIFVQIGDENVHRVRSLMDEVFGKHQFISQISFAKTTGFSTRYLSNVTDHILWFARNADKLKFRRIGRPKVPGDPGASAYTTLDNLPSVPAHLDLTSLGTSDQLTSQGSSGQGAQTVMHAGRAFDPPKGLHWKATTGGIRRLDQAGRVFLVGNTLRYLRYLDDYPFVSFNNVWMDTGIAGFTADKIFVVQTLPKVVQRCLLMATDPGDLVLDPTCGSGTTAFVAEHWGRRWITIDTSRVALALARSRIMGARYPYYTLADSLDGQRKEARLTGGEPKSGPTYEDIRQGFVNQRVPHITLKAIAHNTEIDTIWEQRQPAVETALKALNEALRGHPCPIRRRPRCPETADPGFHGAHESHRTPGRRSRPREPLARMGSPAQGP